MLIVKKSKSYFSSTFLIQHYLHRRWLSDKL